MTRACIAVLALALLVQPWRGARRSEDQAQVQGRPGARAQEAQVPPGQGQAQADQDPRDDDGARRQHGDARLRQRDGPHRRPVGKLTGYVPGKIQLNTDTKAILNGGSIAVAPTDFFSDGCASPVWARSDPATTITLDKTKTNSAVLHSNGSITSDASVHHPRRPRHAPAGRLRPAAGADRLHGLDRVRAAATARSARAAWRASSSRPTRIR